MSKTRAIEIAKYLEQSGALYTTETDRTFFPHEITVPEDMVEKVFEFIAATKLEYGVCDTIIARALDCK